jgi:hypothetical protein
VIKYAGTILGFLGVVFAAYKIFDASSKKVSTQQTAFVRTAPTAVIETEKF